MFNLKNKQFVFKDSYGKLWHFYFDKNQGICYSSLSKRIHWSEPKIIQSEASEQFHADIDEKDCFHIVYQDKKGNLVYCQMLPNESIKAMPILTNKSQSLSEKHLSLVIARNNVYIFFVIEHNDSFMLSYQTISEGVPVAPKKVDNISPLENPYCVIFDKRDDIYAFYHISNGKNNQIGYKKFSLENKVWSEYCQITMFSTNCENPKVLVDRNGIFHICYHRKTEKQYQLIYQQKIPDRNMWTSESIIYGSANYISDFSMLAAKNNLIIYYLRDDVLFPYISTDLGAGFSRPAKGLPLTKQYICIQYKSNSPYEHIYTSEIPATFVNGLRLMFTNDVVDPESGFDTDEMRAIISNDLKQLKKDVVELKETQQSMLDNIQSLLTTQQNIQLNLQKEMAKLAINLRTPSPVPRSSSAPVHHAAPTVPITNPENISGTREELVLMFKNRKKKRVKLIKKFKSNWKIMRH